MTVKSRTIDNLGADASIRYAKDKALYESRFVDESLFISKQSEIPVSSPYVPPEFERLFSSQPTMLWALFAPPGDLFPLSRTIFSYQLIPTLHISDQEDDKDLIEAVEDALGQNKDQDDKEKEQQNIYPKKDIRKLLCYG